MNHNLLIALGCCADDSPTAERLLDWVYYLNGKQPRGHILLTYAHDVHAEMKLKLRICAELAFESVSEFTATSRMLPAPNLKPIELKTKVEFVNNLWNQTAKYVAGHFRFPWLWMEPDCVPTVPNWIELLAEAYAKQPRKFMGRKMKRKVGDNEQLFLSRVAIYPTSAFAELSGFHGTPPFEWVSGPHVMPRATTSKLFQETRYEGDFSTLDVGAALLHSDKTGKLIEQLRERNVQATEHQNGETVEVTVGKIVEDLRNGRTVEADVPMPVDNYRSPEPKDKRTKEWKLWNQRRQDELSSLREG